MIGTIYIIRLLCSGIVTIKQATRTDQILYHHRGDHKQRNLTSRHHCEIVVDNFCPLLTITTS